MNVLPDSRPLVTILIVDDDEEDRMLALDAFKESRFQNPVRALEDGEELIEYLTHTGRYADPATAPRPGLILLDLNMPRMDGREALHIIKQHPDLRRIPVVVLTTSKAEEDIYRTYELGVNSFVVKPVTFDGLVSAVQAIGKYWFELVELPTDD